VRKVLAFPILLFVCHVLQTAAVRADACAADPSGTLICGRGKEALRVFADTASPSKAYAFAWRGSQGLPQGNDIPDGVENVLLRVSDGAVLAKLGGAYWETGQMRANRYDLLAAWSPDNAAVIEVANSRWDSDSFAYYRIKGDSAAKLDLRALVEPALKAKLPVRKRESSSFRVREDLPVTLDARGRAAFVAMVYVPKSDDGLNYKVRVDIAAKDGRLSARIVSLQRTNLD